MIITDTIFEKQIDIIEDTFVVALSGGADSLCLTLLLNDYALKHKCKVIACIIDHKLRSESSTELLPIFNILNKYEIPYNVEIWKHPSSIGGNIEMKARQARYKLLLQYCLKINCHCLCTAHHALDQWETFFMRLSKGSGIRGLSSIKKFSEINGIKLFRPMLKFTPKDIVDTLTNRFRIHNYVNDPMNKDSKFERVKWRQSYEELNQYKLGINNINQSIYRLQRANDCLDNIAKNYFAELFDKNCIDIKKFKELHIELSTRVLELIIQYYFPDKKIISYDLLTRMALKIISPNFKAINFCGLLFKKSKNIKVLFEKRSRH